jgi:tetratricopeptide (TPR) repeat protein
MTQNPQKPKPEKLEVVQNISGNSKVDTVIGVVNGDANIHTPNLETTSEAKTATTQTQIEIDQVSGNVNIDAPKSVLVPNARNVINKIYLPNSIILFISLFLIIAVAAGIYLIVSKPEFAFKPAQNGETLVILASFSGGSKDAEFDPLRILRKPIQNRLERLGMLQDEKMRLEEWIQPISTAQQARELGKKYGATLIIWGEFDDIIGVRTYVEIMKDVPQPDAQQSGNLLPVAPFVSSMEQVNEIGRVPINCLIDDLPHQGDYLTTLAMGILQLTHHDFSGASELFSQSLDAANVTANGLCAITPQHAYYWRGLSYSLLENYPKALADFDQALALQPDFLLALAQRGNANIAMGNPAASQQDYQSALALLYPEDRKGQAALYGNIGLTYELLDQFDHAESYYQKALEINIADDQPEALALDWLHLGSLAIRKHQYDIADENLHRSLKFYNDAKNQQGKAVVLGDLGVIQFEQKDYSGALELFEQALSIRQKMGDKNGEARQLIRIGQVYLTENDTDTAQLQFEQALSISTQTGSIYGQAMAHLGLGMTAYQRKDIPNARDHLQEAYNLLSSIASPDAKTVHNILDQFK